MERARLSSRSLIRPLVVLLLGIQAAIFSQDSAALRNLDDYLQMKMERDKVPGLSICLVKSDSIVWSKSYGWAESLMKSTCRR